MIDGQKFVLDCRMVPQTEYIWGKDGTQYCSRLLRFDDLPGAFNTLMWRQGYPKIKLAPNVVEKQYNSTCPEITWKDIDEKTKDLLHIVYKDDFEKLGYNRVNTTSG